MTTDRAGSDGTRRTGRPERSGVLRWLHYAMGGSLPARLRQQRELERRRAAAKRAARYRARQGR